jgi:hypothetical protein
LTGAQATWKEIRRARFGQETLLGVVLHGEIAGIPQKSLPGSFEVKRNLAAMLHRMRDEG